jgi:hypothetical protein
MEKIYTILTCSIAPHDRTQISPALWARPMCQNVWAERYCSRNERELGIAGEIFDVHELMGHDNSTMGQLKVAKTFSGYLGIIGFSFGWKAAFCLHLQMAQQKIQRVFGD